MRSLYQALRETAKISTAPRTKCQEGCASHFIRPPQSATKVARAMSKFAPRRNESDPTCTKLGEGCTNDIKIRDAPQRERSNTHKVPRGLRERRAISKFALRHDYAIRHAQSCERAARAHARFSQLHAPRKMKSDRTGKTKQCGGRKPMCQIQATVAM